MIFKLRSTILTKENRENKSTFFILVTVIVIFAIGLGAVLMYLFVKPDGIESIPPGNFEKTEVIYNVSSDAGVAIAQNNLPGVVVIETSGGNAPAEYLSMGTGFIVGKYNNTTQPIIMTNYHVINGAEPKDIKIRLFDKADFIETSAEIIGYDSEIDIAILKLNVDLQDIDDRILVWGNSRELQYGQRVIAIGNALGGGISVTSGEVSIPEVVENINIADVGEPEKYITKHLIQTSAAINSGNSGGVLLDMTGGTGKVIGVNTYKALLDDTSDIPADNIGLSVPINMARAVYDWVIRNYEGEAKDTALIRKNLGFQYNFDSVSTKMSNFENQLVYDRLILDKEINSVMGIPTQKLHMGMPIPTASIFSEIVLYCDKNPNPNFTSDNRVLVDGEGVQGFYLQEEIPWLAEYLDLINPS